MVICLFLLVVANLIQCLVLRVYLVIAMFVYLLIEFLREAALHCSQWAILPVRVGL